MKLLTILTIAVFSAFQIFAQSGAAINVTGTPSDASAILDVSSTNQGILIPRMTGLEKNTIPNPANGLLIYQTDNYNGQDTGFYYYKLNVWTPIVSSCSSSGGGTSSNLDFLFYTNKTSTSGASGFNGNTNTDPIMIYLEYHGGDGSPINLAIQGLPVGVTVHNLSPCGGYPSFYSKLTLAYQNTVPPGNYPFTIAAIGGMATKTIIDTLKIVSAKKVFSTSTYHSGNLGGLAGADAICQSRANAAGLSGTYVAWLSTTTVNALDRINEGLFIRTDGVVIANNKYELLGGEPLNSINKDEFGNQQTKEAVWTNTSNQGIIVSLTSTCNNWTSTSGNARIGNLTDITTWSDSWVNESCSGTSPYDKVSLYCFEQ